MSEAERIDEGERKVENPDRIAAEGSRHQCEIMKSKLETARSALRAQEQSEPLTCDGCAHEHCEAPEIENYCWICKRSHPYSDRYEPKGADQ